MAIQIRDLHVAVGSRILLRSASFHVPSNQLTVLVGASGSGKSTVLRIIAGLQEQQDTRSGLEWSGEIHWTENAGERRVGLVFQHPALLDELSGEENVQLAIDHGKETAARAASAENDGWPRTARAWLEHLHVPVSTRISKLSGGQRQRLSLAQTLASRPSLIIFDEPTTGLDASHAHRVAQLIRQTQAELGVTMIVVTHDYESFLGIADQVLLLDSSQADIVPCETRSREAMRDLLETQLSATHAASTPNPMALQTKPWFGALMGRWIFWGMQEIGRVVEWSLARVVDVLPRWPSPKWGLRFFLHYARLVMGLNALLYLAVAGGIIGFVATFFTLKYMPYKIYTEPLLLEELLGAIGFAIYRILIPVMTTILVAARCGAAVSADLGNKRYGNQIESLAILHISPDRYLWTNVLWAFLIGTVVLNQVSFAMAQLSSLAVLLNMHSELGSHFWSHHFYAPLRRVDSWLLDGFSWNLLKLTLSSFGTSLITYRLALRPKHSSSDVSRTITTTILWSTLWALFVHMVVAFYEFAGQ